MELGIWAGEGGRLSTTGGVVSYHGAHTVKERTRSWLRLETAESLLEP